MPLVEKRYAEALVNMSAQGEAIDAYQQDFQAIVSIYNQQPDFRFFLLNPEVRTEIKKEVVKKIFTGEVRVELVNFLMLLLDKHRINFLDGMLKEFIILADKHRNVLNMTIISAAPIDESQVNVIKEKYTKLYNPTSTKVSVEIDKSLIGGIKIKIGDKVIDGTVKGRFKDLKAVLFK